MRMANRHVILLAFAAAILCMASAIVPILSEDADASAGTFTGGANTSSPTNPYTEIDCTVDDLDSQFVFDQPWQTVYYVELGSEFSIKGMDPDNEFQGPSQTHMVVSAVGGQWTSTSCRGFFCDTGEAYVGLAEDYVAVFNVVCTNDTKVQSISVQGASSGTYTCGYWTDRANTEKSLPIYTTPRYSATPAPCTMVTIEQTSGFDVASHRLGTSASGLVPYIYITPLSTGTATFEITASDGGGASTTLTVEIGEYRSGTLTYNGNGGSGAPAQDSDDTYTDEFFYWISPDIPVRDGYTFLGWSESRSATAPDYREDEADGTESRFYTTDTNATLYAVWEQDVRTFTATLRYDGNGGSGAPGDQTASIQGTSATGSRTFSIPSDVPVRDGYEFLGWSMSATGTASLGSGDSVSVAYGSSMTLYAVWQQATVSVTGTPDSHGIVGSAWRYTPTLSTTGCTLSVTGASWLVASGDSVSGTPDNPETYTVTLTASKAGYVTGTQTFTVTVLSALSFQTSPTGGAIIYAV